MSFLWMCFFLALVLVVSAASESYASCSSTPWQYCGSSGSSNGISVDLVKVSNCCSLPCYFTKGENVSVTVVFTADEYFESLELKLCGQLYGSCVDFSLGSSDICSYVSCPLQFKKQYKMKLNVPIKTYWQDVSVTAKWMLEDSDGDQKACFHLPVVIMSSTKKPKYTPETGPPKTPPQPLAKALL